MLISSLKPGEVPEPIPAESEVDSEIDGEEESEPECADVGDVEDGEKDAPAEGLRKAAAALCVHVGSFSDPKEAQGLAHFLEHSGCFPFFLIFKFSGFHGQ